MAKKRSFEDREAKRSDARWPAAMDGWTRPGLGDALIIGPTVGTRWLTGRAMQASLTYTWAHERQQTYAPTGRYGVILRLTVGWACCFKDVT
jgi:hypothetical protein